VKPYYEDDLVKLYHGDCIDVLRELPDASVDSIVTDPPYGLGFMGREWDNLPPGLPWAQECLRVLKPGGHLLAFGGTRTWHRLACAVEDAGFEVRDSIAWMYGSGFPKSLDVSKAIDKAAGAEREVVTGARSRNCSEGWDRPWMREQMEAIGGSGMAKFDITAPATPDAERWQGWGSAMKPAFEPVVVARKPFQGTLAANVLAHGTGALNIDATRIGETVETWPKSRARPLNSRDMHHNYMDGGSETVATGAAPAGRWPANVILDEEMARRLDEQSGESAPKPERSGRKGGSNPNPMDWETKHTDQTGTWPGDNGGGASRFFYVAREDNESCPNPEPATSAPGVPLDELAERFRYVAKAPTDERPRVNGIAHPTTKPLTLMRWLVRLVTPPGGTVLEPFAGSGTTVEACLLEGFQCIAIEREADYLPLIVQRINRRRDPVAAVKAAGDDAGLFDLLDGEAS
jgi:DNA modification methylase